MLGHWLAFFQKYPRNNFSTQTIVRSSLICESWFETRPCSRKVLFLRSPSSLAFRLFIVLNLDSFHGIFFRGARIRRRMTFDTHENLKTKKKYNDDPHSCEFFRKCEKFAKDSGIYKERKDWNTGIQQKKGGICVVLI